MTGGHQPHLGFQGYDTAITNNFNTAFGSSISPGAKMLYKNIKISDTASIAFELWVPEYMIPERLKPGDVIRIKSVVASTAPDFKTVLVPTDHSNLL